jgi:hypothetical protein
MASDVDIRAEQANQVLANPVFQEAYDSMIDGYVQEIADTPIRDSKARNQLGLLLAAASAFKLELFTIIDTAKLDAAQAKDEEEAKLSEELR